eukprot:TRINITY_DN4531_c0_g1_i1.p1 TRINITY_DN4531_c0_g1~~TRINITY_DN4531_c0_g1_i1.p1  ORF type:complete len:480 (-),score=127.52 TRINITY_DN4531_c0_g1_i1:130-1536(-)
MAPKKLAKAKKAQEKHEEEPEQEPAAATAKAAKKTAAAPQTKKAGKKKAEKRPREEEGDEEAAPAPAAAADTTAPEAAATAEVGEEAAEHGESTEEHAPSDKAHQSLTIEQAAEKHQKKSRTSQVIVCAVANMKQITAAFTEAFGPDCVIYKIDHVNANHSPQTLVQVDPKIACQALAAGTVTIDGNAVAVEPGLGTLARAVFLYGIKKPAKLEEAVKQYFEERVGEPGCVGLVTFDAPSLPTFGGMVVFDTVEQAAKAEHPTNCTVGEQSFLVFRDNIQKYEKTIIVRAQQVLSEEDIRTAMDRELGKDSLLAIYRKKLAEKNAALVVLRRPHAHMTLPKKTFQQDGKTLSFRQCHPETTFTAIRMPRYPEVDATPLHEILQYYESKLGRYVSAASRGQLGTVIRFKSQIAAARAIYLGPVPGSGGHLLPCHWFKEVKNFQGTRDDEAPPAKRQNTGGSGGGRGRSA